MVRSADLGEDRCKVSPDRAAETGLVWEEIRKALAATAWDGTQELARYRSYSFERTLNPNRRLITGERGRVVERVARQPYVSRPAELLAQEGYVIEFPDSTVYNLPDPGVLVTVISPPSKPAIRLLMVKPSPVPPNFRDVDVSACTKG